MEDLSELKSFYNRMVFDILGFKVEKEDETGSNEVLEGAVKLLLELRKNAKTNKDWEIADKIRNELIEIGIEIKDTKDGVDWNLK